MRTRCCFGIAALSETDQQQLQRFSAARDVQVILQPSGYDNLQPLSGREGTFPLSYKIQNTVDCSFINLPVNAYESRVDPGGDGVSR